MISSSDRRNASTSRAPTSRKATGMLLIELPEDNWSRNQNRSCAKDSGSVSSRDTRRIDSIGAPGSAGKQVST